MEKKFAKATVILLVGILLQGCVAEQVPVEPAEPDHIVVQLLPYIGYAPLFIAEEFGFFDDENLDVEFIQIRSFPGQVAAILDGSLDVGAPFMNVGMFPGLSGSNIKIVAAKGHVPAEGCPASVLVARKGLKLSGPEDLAGLTVSFTQFSVEQYFMDTILSSVGLTLVDINPLYISISPDEVVGLEDGSIDVSNFAEPWITRTNQSGLTETWIDYGEYIPEFQFAFLMFGPSILEDNPDIGMRFIRAYQKGVAQYNLGATAENTPLLAEFTGLDVEAVQNVCWPPFKDDLSINLASISDFQEWAFENGMIDELTDVTDLIDTQFVDALK